MAEPRLQPVNQLFDIFRLAEVRLVDNYLRPIAQGLLHAFHATGHSHDLIVVRKIASEGQTDSAAGACN